MTVVKVIISLFMIAFLMIYLAHLVNECPEPAVEVDTLYECPMTIDTGEVFTVTKPDTQTFTVTGVVELEVDLIALSDTFAFKPIGDGYFRLVFRQDSSAVSNIRWTIFKEQPCEE